MANGPIMQISLYDENSEVTAEFRRSFVPWKLLKKAISLSKKLNPDDMSDEDVDALASLVVEVFGNQFSVDQINNGADVGEMVTVLNTIVSKATNALGNPTRPGR